MQNSTDFVLASDWLWTHAVPFATAIVILIVGWIAARFANRAIRTYLPNRAHADLTIIPLMAQTARYAILIIAAMMALTQIGVQTTSILAVLGAAGLAVALALQGTLSNIASGVMLIWLRPIAVGEYIDANGTAGTVTEVGLFATRLRAADGVYVFAPNSTIWNTRITNYSRETRRRLDIRVGIGYDADISLARKTLMKIATGEKRLLPDPAPVVFVESLGESSIGMLLRVWVPNPDYWDILFSFTEQVKRDFDKNDIEIPYNKLDVIMVDPEANAAGPQTTNTGTPEQQAG